MTDDAAPGCNTVCLELVESSCNSLAITTAVAVDDAADALANGGAHQPSLADDKSAATSWLGLCQGLTKSPCLTCSTVTPLSEPTLSDVSSSTGNLTPRGNQESALSLQRSTPLRWADETEAEADEYGALETSNILDDDDDDADILETGPDASTPSKRSRRSNRRRRARAEKAAATQAGMLLGVSPGPNFFEPPVPHSPAGRLGIRNSVTVGDLLCASPCNARSGRSPAAAAAEEAAWFVPASPCRAQAGPRGIMSTSPYGAPAAQLTFGYDGCCGYMTGCLSPYTQNFYAVPPQMNDVWGGSSPASPCSRALTGPSGIVGTSPKASGVEAAARTLPPLVPLPVGPINTSSTTPLSSPCHARAGELGGIISTSPTSTGTASFTPMPGHLQLTPGGEVCCVDPAGSPTADAMRSWLYNSGQSCADLAYQLQAAAPEAYED